MSLPAPRSMADRCRGMILSSPYCRYAGLTLELSGGGAVRLDDWLEPTYTRILYALEALYSDEATFFWEEKYSFHVALLTHSYLNPSNYFDQILHLHNKFYMYDQLIYSHNQKVCDGWSIEEFHFLVIYAASARILTMG